MITLRTQSLSGARINDRREGHTLHPPRVSRKPGAVKSAGKVLGRSHVEKLRLEPQRSCGYLYLTPLGATGRTAHIRDQRDPRDPRDRLLEQLQALTSQFDGNRAQPCNIPAWAGKA